MSWRVERTPRALLSLVAAVLLAASSITPAGAIAASGTKGGAAKGGSETATRSGGGSSSSGGASAAGGAEGGAAERGGAAGGGAAGGGAEGVRGRRVTEEEPKTLGAAPIVLGMGGAIVLIGAIAFFIMRDARSHAPVPEGGIETSSKMLSVDHARKRRAKAKAAREQRKRNR